MILIVVVLVKVQLSEVLGGEWFASDGVLSVLLDVWYNISVDNMRKRRVVSLILYCGEIILLR